jgi:hypothetical protein
MGHLKAFKVSGWGNLRRMEMGIGMGLDWERPWHRDDHAGCNETNGEQICPRAQGFKSLSCGACRLFGVVPSTQQSFLSLVRRLEYAVSVVSCVSDTFLGGGRVCISCCYTA